MHRLTLLVSLFALIGLVGCGPNTSSTVNQAAPQEVPPPVIGDK